MRSLLRMTNKSDDSLDSELIRLLEKSIQSRKGPEFEHIFSSNYQVHIDSLYSTMLQIIQLLSRKRINNSFHMHLIMIISEEINKFICNYLPLKKQEANLNYLFRNAEILLKNCLEIMETAEAKTRNYKNIEKRYIFKDEKELIQNYFLLSGNKFLCRTKRR